MYKLTNNNSVKRLSDEAFIPFDVSNRDYREYLAWLERGNVPEPADEVAPEPDFIEYSKSIKAPDFVVASPKPKDKPDEALKEAVKIAKRPHGTAKSIPEIVLNLINYIDDLENRVAALEKKR